MDKLTAAIAESPLFKDLDESHRNKIRQIAIEKAYHKSETVFAEGDESNGFYLVVEGQVKVFKLSPDGKEKILHIFTSGEPFGEVAMFSGSRFPANVETLAKSRLAFFPREAFIQLIKDQPTLTMSMMAMLSRRLKQFTEQIEELTLKDVPGRVAGYLITLAEEQDNMEHVRLTITKGQLAGLLGTIPETLSRMMARMSVQNLIDVRGREIAILDPEGLRELATGGRFFEDKIV